MKKLSIIPLIALLWGAALGVQAQDFEGVIHFEVPEMAKQGMSEMPYMVKGNKARMEMGHQKMKAAVILLPEESKMVMVMDQMKGYVEMDTDEPISNNSDNQQMEEASESDFQNTGETKTIAGKTCEVWKMASDSEAEGVFEACMAKGMGTFTMPANQMRKDQAPEWAQSFAEEGAMPLEIVEVKNGKRSVKMKAVKIEEKSLSDDLFEVPEGYRDMSGMMKGMQNRN